MFVFVLAIAIAALIGWLVRLIVAGTIDRGLWALGALIGGWRPDPPWPRGVQEEDRDRPWGRGVADSVKPLLYAVIEPGLTESKTAVATGHVKPRTRPR